MARGIRCLVALALALVLATCAGDDTLTGPSIKPPTAVAFTVQPSTAVAGAGISPAVLVRVQDSEGNTVTSSTAAITVAITSGRGTSGAVLSGTLTRSAVNGVATFNDLTIDKAGTGYTLNASATSLAGATSSSFTVNHGAASKLVYTGQPGTAIAGAGISPAIKVTVQDAHGNTVTNSTVSVTLSITGGTGTSGAVLGGTLTRAAISGIATFSDVTIDQAGSGYTLSATAPSLTEATSTSFTVNPGAPDKLVYKVQPSTVAVDAAISPPVEVTVQDAEGNTVTSSTIGITLALAGGTGTTGAVLGGTLTRAAISGIATFNDLTIDRAGNGYILSATAAGLTEATSTSFTVSAGAPSKLVYTVQPSTLTSGAAMSPAVEVTVQDADGNTITNSTVSVTLSITGGTGTSGAVLGGTLTQAAVSGVARFNDLTVDRAGSGYTLSATAPDLAGAASSSFAVLAGAPSKLGYVVQPSTAMAGAAISPGVVLTVQDAQGNTVISSTASITLGITGGTGGSGAVLGGTLTRPALSGMATFGDLTIDKADSGYTLTATATDLTGVVSSSFTITAGAASKLAFTAGPAETTEAGMPLGPVRVEVQDAFGNLTPATDSVSVRLAGNSGTVLNGTLTVATVSGQAVFEDLVLAVAASGYSLVASSGLFTPDTTAVFSIIAAAAQSLVFVTAPGSGTVAGTPLPPFRMEARDQFDNLATGFNAVIDLSYAANPGQADLLGQGSVPAVGGAATFDNVIVGRPGDGYQFSAASGALSALSSTFDVAPPTVVQALTTMAASDNHTCALTDQGAAYCWGTNIDGRLGDGSTVSRGAPTAVVGGLTFAAVVTGNAHSCGLTSSGATYCWGDNVYGQLGNGTTADGGTKAQRAQTTPTLVVGGHTFTTLVAGYAHTCGMVATGAVYCWGFNGQRQLGDGPGRSGFNQNTPVSAGSGMVFAAIAARHTLTCGLTADGALYCWGHLGGNMAYDPENPGLPALASGGVSFSSVAAGYGHICGLTSAGAAYCLGWNDSGQRGESETRYDFKPYPVTGGLVFSKLVAGNHHTCGITAQDGTYCWGANTFGAVGDGTLSDRFAPSSVAGGLDLVVLAAGGHHTCGVTANGLAHCWGDNSTGQLGADEASPQPGIPTPVRGGATYSRIAAGAQHTCALTDSGATFCWGDNRYGQVGDGTTVRRRSAPTLIAGGLTLTDLVAGDAHTCGLTSTGTAYCWGDNDWGQLGIGSTNDRAAPTPVLGGINFAGLAAGSIHTCGWTAAGTTYCWGYSFTSRTVSTIPLNLGSLVAFMELVAGGAHTCGRWALGTTCWGDTHAGRLGDQTALNSLGFTSLAAGYNHSCGLTAAGEAYCWGGNYVGQLGTGTTGGSMPSPVLGSHTFIKLASGSHSSHTCGVTPSGSAYCWGNNEDRQLGDDTAVNRSSPTLVLGENSFTAVTAGWSHTCGLASGGSAYCWGDDHYLQLATDRVAESATPLPVLGGLVVRSQ